MPSVAKRYIRPTRFVRQSMAVCSRTHMRGDECESKPDSSHPGWCWRATLSTPNNARGGNPERPSSWKAGNHPPARPAIHLWPPTRTSSFPGARDTMPWKPHTGRHGIELGSCPARRSIHQRRSNKRSLPIMVSKGLRTGPSGKSIIFRIKKPETILRAGR